MNRIYITVLLLGLFLNFSSCKQNTDQSKKVGQDEQKMTAEKELEYLIRMPNQSSDQPVPLLLLLHGLGSNELDMHGLAKGLDPRCLILSVRAPYKLAENKFSWYQLDLNGGDFKYSYDELKMSRAKLIRLIKSIQEEYNIDEQKILIGGFSQGAIMSLAASLTHSELIDGAMVLSGDLLDELEKEIEGKRIEKGLDVFISHGRKDRVLSFAEAVKDIKFLKAKGIDVYESFYDSAHTISRENFKSLSTWLKAKIDHQ